MVIDSVYKMFGSLVAQSVFTKFAETSGLSSMITLAQNIRMMPNIMNHAAATPLTAIRTNQVLTPAFFV